MVDPVQVEETIFHAARVIPATQERAAYLAQACGQDDVLRSRVEALLKVYLSEPSSDAVAPGAGSALFDEMTAAPPPVEEPAGTIIGRYKLLERIGEGGFGVVFMAEQQSPVRRKVALKVIKPGLDTKQVIARFEAERQALAMMEHDNIARVLDGGATESGRPYFVMELVHGVPITKYCDENRLSPRQRLELFVQVCRAVQHAHSKGVIHRDIKPTNVLVTLHDGAAVPKVIDFGVAKATGQQPLTDRTLFTQFAQMVGTPLYMSPEQAEMSGLDVDTRSDVYSLGVLLYELLTGTTPFDKDRLKQAAHDEVRRIIREEEPPRPSTRLSAAAELASIAASRGVEPKRLSSMIQGELDWIVMKALEKHRARRYATANGFARDVERYLHDEPVQACPPSKLYRVQKLIRRNKLAVAAISAVLTALILGLGVSTWLFAREKSALRRANAAEQEQVTLRRLAEAETQKAGQVAAFMKDMLRGVGPSVALGRDTHMLREILDQTAKRLDGLRTQPAAEADLRATLGSVYFDLGEYSEAIRMHEQALTLQRRLFGNTNAAVAQSLNDLGLAYQKQAKYREAEAAHREALAIRTALFGAEHLQVAASMHNLGESLRRPDVYGKETISLFRAALEMRTKLLGEEDPDVADSMSGLAMAIGNKDLRQALKLHRRALEIRRKVLGNEHPDVASSIDRLAGFKGEDSETLRRESLAIRRKLFAPDHPELATSLQRLAAELRRKNKFDEAEPLAREALTVRRKRLPHDHIEIARSCSTLANILWRQGKPAEAEPLFREEWQICRKLLYEHDAYTKQSFAALCGVLREQQRTADIDELYREQIRDVRSLSKPDDRRLADLLELWVVYLSEQRRFAEAETPARECLSLREKNQNDHLRIDRAHVLLGKSLLRQKKYPQAESLLLAAYKSFQSNPDWIATNKPIMDSFKDLFACLVSLYEETAQPEQAAAWRSNKSVDLPAMYQRAAKRYRTSAQGGDVNGQRQLAWLLATCPDEGVRNGAEAVEFAGKAVAAALGPANGTFLDTLAAACAEAGRFDQAIKAEKEAIATTDDWLLEAEFTSRLRLYEGNTPYHEKD